eukprot:Skav217347  [mRNA]  locus=scaffold1410:411965:416167:- [translate_table: standard]
MDNRLALEESLWANACGIALDWRLVYGKSLALKSDFTMATSDSSWQETESKNAPLNERMKKLKAEELAELEGADAAEAEPEAASEPPEKRQKRCKGKTETLVVETDVSIAREVDKDLEANGDGAEDGGDGANASARHAAREKQREALQRMQQCYAQRVHFVELLDAAEARLRGLLSSKTATDVTEAISVVVELRLRGVPAAAKAFHQVLGLVWSRHAPIKDAAVDAFYRMHLEGRDTSSAADAVLQIYKAPMRPGMAVGEPGTWDQPWVS